MTDAPRIAVMADVHSNLQALEAVLAVVADVGVDHTICLGDVVGYNARPRECVQLVRDRCDIVVTGNHDRSVVEGNASRGTVSSARWAQDWTRSVLAKDEIGWLSDLPRIFCGGADFVAVHGCYLNDLHYTGYVTSTMLDANLAAILLREDWARVALCGHTHIPMCGWVASDEIVEATEQGALNWPETADAVLINPGSVGQPRDGDARASFALVDLRRRTVEARKVEYDVESAVVDLLRAGLPADLGQRLREGR